MSFVYTVVIQMMDYKEREEAALAKLNDYVVREKHAGNLFSFLDGSKSAGTKSPERSLIWGGFNYLNKEEFISLFKSLQLENALLTISTPGDSYVIIPSNTEIEARK